MEAEYQFGNLAWTRKYQVKTKDKSFGGESQTGVLEKAWDDLTLQALKDILEHLAKADPS